MSLPIMSDAAEKKPSPYPPTKIEPVVEKMHGVEIVDPYRWLEDGASPAVKEWTDEGERLHAVRSRQAARPRQDPRPAEYAARHRQSEYAATGQGQILLHEARAASRISRSSTSATGLHGKDRVLLDPNELDKEGTTALDWWYPNDDGSLLAYGLSTNGSEQSTLRIRDVSSGKDLPDVIERTRYCSLAWTPDGKGFYYTRYPAVGSVPQGRGELSPSRLLPRPRRRPGEGREGVRRGPGGGGHAGRRVVAGRPLAGRHGGAGLGQDGGLFRRLDTPTKMRKGRCSSRWSRRWTRPSASFRATTASTSRPTKTARASAFWRSIRSIRGRATNGRKSFPKGRTCWKASPSSATCIVGQYMEKASSRLRLFDKAGKLLQEVPLPTLGTLAGLGGEWRRRRIAVRLPVVHAAAEHLPARPEEAGGGEAGAVGPGRGRHRFHAI